MLRHIWFSCSGLRAGLYRYCIDMAPETVRVAGDKLRASPCLSKTGASGNVASGHRATGSRGLLAAAKQPEASFARIAMSHSEAPVVRSSRSGLPRRKGNSLASLCRSHFRAAQAITDPHLRERAATCYLPLLRTANSVRAVISKAARRDPSASLSGQNGLQGHRTQA
jgi:hypothetical protein